MLTRSHARVTLQVVDVGIQGLLNSIQGSVWSEAADVDADRDGLRLQVPAKSLADIQELLKKAKAEGKKTT